MKFDYSEKNKRWQTVRARVLRRDKGLCRECARYGRRVEATVVHHIRPADLWPELAYEDSNLISLCAASHEAMHVRTSGELSDVGREWLRRSPPPPGADCGPSVPRGCRL